MLVFSMLHSGSLSNHTSSVQLLKKLLAEETEPSHDLATAAIASSETAGELGAREYLYGNSVQMLNVV